VRHQFGQPLVVHGPYIRPSLLFFFLSAALFNSHNSIHPLLLFATRHVIYAQYVSCPLFSHHKLRGSLVGAEPEHLYNRDFALQHLVSNEYNMSDPFYRHMKGLLGSRDSGGASSTSDASPASQDSNPPNDSPTPQAINPLLDMSIEMSSSSSSSGDYRQRIWDYRLKTHDRWIFDLLSRDKWPQGTPCEAWATSRCSLRLEVAAQIERIGRTPKLLCSTMERLRSWPQRAGPADCVLCYSLVSKELDRENCLISY
jgi:hypothetical protein